MRFGAAQFSNWIIESIWGCACGTMWVCMREKCYWTTDYITSWISFMHGWPVVRVRSCFRNELKCIRLRMANKKYVYKLNWIKLLVRAQGTLAHSSTIRFAHTHTHTPLLLYCNRARVQCHHFAIYNLIDSFPRSNIALANKNKQTNELTRRFTCTGIHFLDLCARFSFDLTK